MKRAVILILAVSSYGLAQDSAKVMTAPSASAGVVAWRAFEPSSAAPVQGAPYSATTTNENIQTLADGNRIVQTSTGSTARDSQGRTRQDESLPAIGNLSAADAPHLVFIQDPVAQTVYTLNLTDKTARKMPALPPKLSTSGTESGSSGKFMVQMGTAESAGGPDLAVPPDGMVMQRTIIATRDQGKPTTEDLGSQTMEGVLVNGVRTTHTIPAGE